MSEQRENETPRRIKSVQTASTLLDSVQYLSDPTFSDLCEEVEMSKGTVHTYLTTLADEGLLTRSNGTYRLGLRCIPMGESVRNRTDLYRLGQAEVEELAERTNEWVHLTVEDRGREVTIHEERGDNAVAVEYHHRMRESPQHLHYSASGKAMLAFFGNDRVEAILENRGLIERTDNTITDRERLFRRLETIRDRGYAVNDEEEVRGMRSVGAPILDSDSGVRGAISVTAPTSRLSEDRFETAVPKLVKQTANIIEVNLETAELDGRKR